jgi:hypothetical protein
MESKDYKLTEGRILRVIQDENAESPDKWGNTDMFLVYDHRQFNIKRDGFDPQDIAEWYQASFRTLDYNGYHVFPVAAYIHSGVILNLTNSLQRQGWDTSVCGFVLVHKEKVILNKINITKSNEAIAEDYAGSLLNTWNQYLSGDVWGFRVFKKVKYYKISKNTLYEISSEGRYSMDLVQFLNVAEEISELEEEDSCWGFYGSNIKTNGILDHISYKLIEDKILTINND